MAKACSLYVKPNWRYEALLKPAKYDLQAYVTTPKENSGCLKRYIAAGLPFEVKYSSSKELKRYLSALPPRQADKLSVLWERYFKKSKQNKIDIDAAPDVLKSITVWNIDRLKHLQDKFLVRLIKHVSNYQYDRHIAFALELHRSKEYDEIFRFIGYCFYAKVSDSDIAKRWNISIKNIEAVRQLFFDFTKFPKDRIANFTYLRQLTATGDISDLDFAYYKRVYELGELGLKAQHDFFNLTDVEKHQVEVYLGKSIVANTFNINFNIRDAKDAASYGTVVATLSNHYIKETEAEYFKAKIKNLDACTRRIEGGMVDSAIDMSELDKQMMKLLEEHSIEDPQLEYKTIASLKKNVE